MIGSFKEKNQQKQKKVWYLQLFAIRKKKYKRKKNPKQNENKNKTKSKSKHVSFLYILPTLSSFNFLKVFIQVLLLCIKEYMNRIKQQAQCLSIFSPILEAFAGKITINSKIENNTLKP